MDGKIDQDTLPYKETDSPEGESVIRKCVETEHHLAFTNEIGKFPGTYLTHRKIPIIRATGEVLAQETLSVLQEYNSFGSIQVLLDKNRNKYWP